MQSSPNAAGELAARLLYLAQQKSLIEAETTKIKEALEELYAGDAMPAKSDVEVLYSDGTYHKVRLMRKKTGSYFKVADDFKADFSADKARLEARYLKDGRAEMAEKACTWVATEVKA